MVVFISLMRCSGDLYFFLGLRSSCDKGWLKGNEHKSVSHVLDFTAFRVLIERIDASASSTPSATELKAPVTAWAPSF